MRETVIENRGDGFVNSTFQAKRCLISYPLLVLFLGGCVATCSTAFCDENVSSDLMELWLSPQAWVRDTSKPILELGEPGAFDDMHILTPLVALENDKYRLWYSGSRGEVDKRIFRLGMATSSNGKSFNKYASNPIFEFGNQKHSIVTPTFLRKPSGAVLREHGKLRMWFIAVDFAGNGMHTLHESTSSDGVLWSKPSDVQRDNIYAPTILKENDVYRMWYIDVSGSPWTVRHAKSHDGKKWRVSPQICLSVDQPWEKGNLFYPTVLKSDGLYLM